MSSTLPHPSHGFLSNRAQTSQNNIDFDIPPILPGSAPCDDAFSPSLFE